MKFCEKLYNPYLDTSCLIIKPIPVILFDRRNLRFFDILIEMIDETV